MYEIKGRISEDSNAHWVIEDAQDIVEAIKVALDNGMYEIYAVHLSKVKEVIGGSDGHWYRATLKEERIEEQQNGKKPKVKTVTYQMLVRADDFKKASAILDEQIAQGYDLVTYGMTESHIDDIIKA